LAVLLGLAAGCASRSGQPAASQLASTQQRDEMAQLRAQLAERDRRLSQLEGRLGLLEAAQRELRYAVAEADRGQARETMAVGEREPRAGSGRSAREERTARAQVQEAPREEPRPLLRLYEERASKAAPLESSSEPRLEAPARASLMPVPQISERLPVAPVPSLSSVAQAQATREDPTDQYRRAIDLVRQREFPRALQVLDDFLAHFQGDTRVAKVMFWRGEVLFAQRDYGAALTSYEDSLTREPRGEKAPDSLLKIGLCHRRLGASERAQEAMQRLRSQFPESAAARLLNEEDA